MFCLTIPNLGEQGVSQRIFFTPYHTELCSTVPEVPGTGVSFCFSTSYMLYVLHATKPSSQPCFKPRSSQLQPPTTRCSQVHLAEAHPRVFFLPQCRSCAKTANLIPVPGVLLNLVLILTTSRDPKVHRSNPETPKLYWGLLGPFGARGVSFRGGSY